MTLIESNKEIIQEKNINIFLEDCFDWRDELIFLDTEINFLKIIIISYSFETSIPNLFEKIELFISKFNAILDAKNIICESIKKHQNMLEKMKTDKIIDSIKLLIEQHKNLESKVFAFFTEYKNDKREFYDYMLSLIR
ncbi:MAG: hypothetical protein HKN90_04630 [Flavobacteriaceae bacterium]|nr:hypothetical protein [Flavobacteriaceae bacterium]